MFLERCGFFKGDLMVKRKIAVIILLILGVFGAVAAKTGMFIEFETAFARFINPNRNSGVFFRIFSEIGEFYFVISVIAVLFIFKNRCFSAYMNETTNF
mgnify:CR=1 FL=1